MEAILRVVGGVLSVYMLLLFIRILLTWFSGPSLGKPQEVLTRITDPYLNIFRRITFLRAGQIDFSPMAAIISLVIVLNIVNRLRFYGEISVGIVLALIVAAVWSAAFFVLGFFIILTVVRFISVLVGGTSFSPFWQTIDLMVNPMLAFIQQKVLRGRQVSYKSGLGIGILVLLAAAVIGRIIVNLLVGALQRIPF
jgi:YggT family protein